MSRVERSRREKVTRYSVRKVSFGAASVAVAAFFMFLGNGAVYATEPNVTATDSALAATPANNQLDENSGASDSTAPKAQADTTTPTPADSSSTSVESAPASTVQDETPAPTPVAESASVTPAPASSTEEVEEKATSDLDKKQLEDYVAEIDAKLASGSYATKTDESVATLKEHLGLAKLALTTAKSQDELTKAYRRLFTTVNSGLRSKPKAQVESPKLDTTEGKATVGKKASNTEKATESNSIANSGKHDSRNGQALDRNNPFRTGEATTDSDLAANQVYTAPRANANVEELVEKLQTLPNVIENNKKVKDMDALGDEQNVDPGTVKEITEFGGWKAVGENGKFAIAKATDKGVFPIETINVPSNNNAWIEEQSFDKSSKYMLFLSKVRTKANSTDEAFDGSKYVPSGEGGARGAWAAKGTKGFDGIEKTFKSYTPETGSKVKIKFKTGYTGIVESGPIQTRALYKVTVIDTTDGKNAEIYSTTFDPGVSVSNDKMTVVAARNGSGGSVRVNGTSTEAKNAALETMSQSKYKSGSGGTFESQDIVLAPGVKTYKVVIRSGNDAELGMSYQSNFLQYALPLTGLDYTINQETNEVAKSILQRIYTKLKDTVVKDEKGMTAESKAAYDAELEKVRSLVEASDLTTTAAYKDALTIVLQKKDELKVDKSSLAAARTEIENLITTVSTEGKVQNSIDEYNKVKAEAQTTIDKAKKIIDSDASTVDEVALAVAEVKQKKAELKAAEAALVDKMTDSQKAALAEDKVNEDLKLADTAGKTPESADAYNKAVEKLNAALAEAKAKAKEVVAKGDNATKAEAAEVQATVAELKAKLVEAGALLKDKADKDALTKAKEALATLAQAADPTAGKTEASKTAYEQAKAAAEAAVAAATQVINNENATPEQVATALVEANAKKVALETAKAGLVDRITQDQKDELANADQDLKLADTTGKTNDSIKAYNDEVGKLSVELEAAKQAAKDLLAKGDNAGELEAYRLQSKISKLKSKLATAAKLLKDIDKSAVKKEVEEAAKNATDAIEANVDLTAEQKEAAKAKVAEEVNKSIAAIDDATTEDDVTAAKNAGKLAIAKEGAKAELEAAQAIKEKAIAGNDKLSDAEKQAVKEQVNNIVDEAKKAIDTATGQSEVDSAKTTGKEAIDALNPVGKEKALDEIQKVIEAKLEAIDKNEKLSDKEKAAAKAAVAKAAIAVVEAIKEATDQATVDAKVTEGTKAILSVAEVGKDKAKSALDSALSAKETAIDSNDKLSDTEKSAAKAAAKQAAEDAKKAIEASTSQAEVDANVTKGTDSISSVAEVGKEQAKSALDSALSAKETAIDNNVKLSDAEKSAAKASAKKAAEDAKKAIESATSQAEVDANVTKGTDSISSVAEVGKEQAKSALDSALSAKETAIDNNAKLSEAEKSAAKAAAKKAAEDAKKAIEASTSQAEVDANVTKGTDSISSVAEVGKDNAKAAVDAALADKEAAIDANDKLSESEKSAAKAAAKQAADDAKKAIDASTTQAEVDRILRNDIYKDDAAINEVEAFDLSSLLVNGFVSVKQGETLTDQEVLSKVNLPKDVEVIKIEKPTTSALGRLVAKVTLKLSDGSVEEINVPVEVVAPQNHGNEGNGANNGANNTEAKADKAKLEAAIHQLDELLLKESAKLDAETAKEANDLLADAKKVFANADASQAEVDAMVKRIEDFMEKVSPSTDHATPATAQVAANAGQTASAQANARKAAKELPNTGTADSTVAMVAAAASALLGLGLAGRRKEDEEA